MGLKVLAVEIVGRTLSGVQAWRADRKRRFGGFALPRAEQMGADAELACGSGRGAQRFDFPAACGADEHKDNEDDTKYRMERPVPRGLVTLKELAGVAMAGRRGAGGPDRAARLDAVRAVAGRVGVACDHDEGVLRSRMAEEVDQHARAWSAMAIGALIDLWRRTCALVVGCVTPATKV